MISTSDVFLEGAREFYVFEKNAFWNIYIYIFSLNEEKRRDTMINQDNVFVYFKTIILMVRELYV